MEKTGLNHIKKRIAELLEPRGLKAELARRLGFKPESITDMLKKPGDPAIHYVQAVSQLTGRSVAWLLTGKEDSAQNPVATEPHKLESAKLEMLVASQKRTIELLEKEVTRLENEIKQMVNK